MTFSPRTKCHRIGAVQPARTPSTLLVTPLLGKNAPYRLSQGVPGRPNLEPAGAIG